MSTPNTELEDLIIPSKWTERDDDIVVRATIYRELGLESKTELD